MSNSSDVQRKNSLSYSSVRRGSKTTSNGTLLEKKDLQIQLEERKTDGPPGSSELEHTKQYYSYQIETLKDDLEELEESYFRLQRDYKDKARNLDLLSRDYAKLKEDQHYLKELLRVRDEIINASGLVMLNGDGLPCMQNEYENGDVHENKNGYTCDESTKMRLPVGMPLISKETAAFLNGFEGDSLDEKLKSVSREVRRLVQEIEQLKIDFKMERERRISTERDSEEHTDARLAELQMDYHRQIQDYKLRLKEAEQDNGALRSTVDRLETQLERVKHDLKEAHELEDELKSDKRKAMRELRCATARIEELETTNSHLERRIEKWKSSRLALLNSD